MSRLSESSPLSFFVTKPNWESAIRIASPVEHTAALSTPTRLPPELTQSLRTPYNF